MHSTQKLVLVSLACLIVSVLTRVVRLREAPSYAAAVARVRSQTREATADTAGSSISSNSVKEQNLLRVEASYGNLPLSFEANHGRTDSRVKFLSRAGSRTLWLTNDEAVLAVGRRPQAKGTGGNQGVSAPGVLRIKFTGANADPSVRGEGGLSGTVNYFSGTPDEWRTRIPTYARVRYRNLYPGIDLVFYGNNRELEYDLVVAPGVDPGKIKLAISGTENLSIDRNGNLILKTPAGNVIQQKPKIYQRKGTNLAAIAGDYVITGGGEVSFRLGSYDRSRELVIDPVLRYSSFLGGSGIDSPRGIAVDPSNRAVVAGLTCSLNFPHTTGPASFQGCAAFVTKFNFTGSGLVFSTFVGESNFEFFDVGGMALDSAGNTYITGITENVNFPTTPGAFQTTLSQGSFGAFVSKINASGTALVYSTFLGGGLHDEGHAIAVDSSGNAYVAGETHNQDFPTTAGAFQHDCKLNGVSCDAAFVTKFNASGSHLLYSTFLSGSTGESIGFGIALNRSGNAFVTGFTAASDFPTTAGSAQPVFGGGAGDAFVAELSSSGSHLIYSTYLGGSGIGVGGTGSDSGSAIALDSTGNAFVTGGAGSFDFPVRNAFQPTCHVAVHFCVNAFVTKLNSSGRIVYSTFLGGGGDGGSGIAVTPGGQAYVTGTTMSGGFPTTQNAFQRVLGGPLGDFGTGANDTFITKFSPTGKLIYSSYLGGSGDDVTAFVALDRDANAYVAGTAAASFPVTPGAFEQKFGGGSSDAFVAKVVPLCALSTVNRSVTICMPSAASRVASPVRIVAGTTDVAPVKLTQVYLDGKKIYEARLSAINVGLPIAAGSHRLTVQAFDTSNVIFKKSITVSVSPH